jgi:hypothetical protein
MNALIFQTYKYPPIPLPGFQPVQVVEYGPDGWNWVWTYLPIPFPANDYHDLTNDVIWED